MRYPASVRLARWLLPVFAVAVASALRVGLRDVMSVVPPVLLFFGPVYMVGAYVALGVVVGISHLLFPKPRTAVAETGSVVELPAHVERPVERELIAA